MGALARHARVEHDQPANQAVPLLGQAIGDIAHTTVRNRGTVVGSLVHADPAAELPAVLVLLGGSMDLASAGDGTRRGGRGRLLPRAAGVGRAGELATAALFPRPPAGGSAWTEVARRHGDYAVCGAGALVVLDDELKVASARAALISVGPVPVSVDLTDAVGGQPHDGADWAAAGRLAAAATDPDDDIHATAAYRRHLAGVLTARAARAAAANAASRLPEGPGNPEVPRSIGRVREPRRCPGGWGGGGVSEPLHETRLVVNGVPRTVAVPARRLLSDCLRHDLGLTGTHVGCEHGVCGACTVLVDGRPMRSCLLFAVGVDGAEITTVEGCRSPGGGLGPVQQAFQDCHGLQCGFCTPGSSPPSPPGCGTTPTPPRSRPARPSAATCAAAPATRTSSPRSCGPPSCCETRRAAR